MKILKPQRLSLLHRVVEIHRQPYLVLASLAFFRFSPRPSLLTEAALWIAVPEVLGPAVLDECLPKSRGELLVAGACHARPSQSASYVRVRSRTIDKMIAVLGDRRWKDGVPTPPDPFTTMPITWDRAFGGPGHASNPSGKGLEQTLSNLEDPRHLVRSPRDRPAPVCLGPLDAGSPQRMKKAGTYDDAWLKELSPGFARDLDVTYFNAAPDDQQIDDFFAPGDSFSVENMHPTKATLEGSVPRIGARSFVRRSSRSAIDDVEEIETRLDTIWLFPHLECGVAIFRGMTEVAEDDASDIDLALLAFEDSDRPRDTAYYRRELSLRLDPDKGHLHSLRDAALLPASIPTEGGMGTSTAGRSPNETLERAKRRMAREFDAARQRVKDELLAHGLNPEQHLPQPPDLSSMSEAPPSLDDVGALVERIDREEKAAVAAKEEAERMRAEMQASARATCEGLGLDYDALVAEGRQAAAGPPKFSAEAEVVRLSELCRSSREEGAPLPDLENKLLDAKFLARMEQQERAQNEMYRQSAHLSPVAAARKSGANGDTLRRRLLDAHAARASVADQDFTGVDLSGMDLRGANLAGAFLESANLSKTDLRNADLSQAVLAHADLRGARLDECRLRNTNLGAANLEGASLRAGDATSAILAKATLSGASLVGALLDGVDWSEAIFDGADLSGVVAPSGTFHKSRLARVRFVGAKLTKANFLQVDVRGCDFTKADLSLATFLAVNADEAIFREATMRRFHAVSFSSFEKCDFRRACLGDAFLRDSCMTGSTFDEAELSDADLSGSDLRFATFVLAVAKRAQFVKSDLTNADMSGVNLMNGSLQKAKVFGAKLVGMNLFRSDLSKLRVDTATKLEHSLMTQARIYPKAIHESR